MQLQQPSGQPQGQKSKKRCNTRRVRVAPLSRDRDGCVYWQLACAAEADAAPGSRCRCSWLDAAGVERWGVHSAAAAPGGAAAMAPNGEREGRLRAALLRRYAAPDDDGSTAARRGRTPSPRQRRRSQARKRLAPAAKAARRAIYAS